MDNTTTDSAGAHVEGNTTNEVLTTFLTKSRIANQFRLKKNQQKAKEKEAGIQRKKEMEEER